MFFQVLMTKNIIFQIFQAKIQILQNCQFQKADCSLNILAIPIHFVPEPQSNSQSCANWEYRLRFFPRENFMCSCGKYPIKTRCHILYNCRRFNNYHNLRRDFIAHFIFSQNLMIMHSPSLRILNSYMLLRIYYILFFFSFCSMFSFFSFSSFLSILLSMQLVSIVSSYKVATTACLHTLCNKSLN